MRKLKLVQVGLGFWGQDWAEEILPNAAEVEVVGYVDPAPEALAARRRRGGGPVGGGGGGRGGRGSGGRGRAAAPTRGGAVPGPLRKAPHFPVVREALLADRH